MTSEHDFVREFRGEERREWPRGETMRVLRWVTIGALIGGCITYAAVRPAASSELAPSYLGIQGGPSFALNSTQSDRYEARSQAGPTIAAFAGWHTRFDWLDIQATGRWLHQEAHGYNRGSLQESVDGDMDGYLLTVGPVARADIYRDISIYSRFGAGPAYRTIDFSNGSLSGEKVNKSGVVLALEGAAGIERRIDERFSVRLEAGCQYADPMQACGGNVALVMRFDWAGETDGD